MSTCRHFNSDCTVDYIKKICILTVLSKVTMAEHEGKCDTVSVRSSREMDYAPDSDDSR